MGREVSLYYFDTGQLLPFFTQLHPVGGLPAKRYPAQGHEDATKRPLNVGNSPGMKHVSQNSEIEVTQLLSQARAGDKTAADRVIGLVYEELRLIAYRHAARGKPNGTLGGTALVHEAILNLFPAFSDEGLDSQETDSSHVDEILNCKQVNPSAWNDRAHFFNAASATMRNLLIDYARQKGTQQRGGGWRQIPLDFGVTKSRVNIVDVLAVEEALLELEQINPRHAKVVEQRVFGNFTMKEIAAVLDVSLRTVQDDWSTASLWLKSRLRDLKAIIF